MSSLDASDLERFERSLDNADMYKVERILGRLNPDQFEGKIEDMDLVRLQFEMAISMRRLAAMIVRIPLITGFPGFTDKKDANLVGSVDSNRYHLPFCRWAKKIAPERQIWFSDPKDAKSRGYVPCGVCKPA